MGKIEYKVITRNEKIKVYKVNSWNGLIKKLAADKVYNVIEIYTPNEVGIAEMRAMDYRRYLKGFKP